MRATTDALSALDDEFGGGHARHAVTAYLTANATDSISKDCHRS